jgi:hypothetical protein
MSYMLYGNIDMQARFGRAGACESVAAVMKAHGENDLAVAANVRQYCKS